MSDLGFEFNPDEVEDTSEGFTPVPDGEYVAIFEKSEVKPTKAGGKYLSIQWRITGPTHGNRVIFDNITLQNKSDKAQSIGRQQLKKLCAATGTPGPIKSADVFTGKTAIITVRTEVSEQYGASNTIKGYKKSSGPPVVSGGTSSESAPKAPWM